MHHQGGAFPEVVPLAEAKGLREYGWGRRSECAKVWRLEDSGLCRGHGPAQTRSGAWMVKLKSLDTAYPVSLIFWIGEAIVGTDLYIAGCLTPSLASTPKTPVYSSSCDNQMGGGSLIAEDYCL